MAWVLAAAGDRVRLMAECGPLWLALASSARSWPDPILRRVAWVLVAVGDRVRLVAGRIRPAAPSAGPLRPGRPVLVLRCVTWIVAGAWAV
ncbi:hypothetical protein Adi01nite_53160 [Amorphoplanes digitatis]|nr:hypothetical protein Adi01nite_53160 [Actinoplanes digitatis]